jgi:tetratricopeptide (TPR) repeat protein
MALPVPDAVPGVLRAGWRVAVLITSLAIALGGCSINLGSLSSEPDTPPAPTADAGKAGIDVSESQAATGRGQALARSGKIEQALDEFNTALQLNPHNAQALYNRGLLYQGEKQHEQAIEDFTAANGLTPQRPEPLLARAISYLALDKVKEAAADLDEAVQDDPQNAEIWLTRGIAYERLGDKTRAAESYGHALNIRPRDEAARSGFARVGGRAG